MVGFALKGEGEGEARGRENLGARTPAAQSILFGEGRLQNSPYFCVFKYARAVKQKVWNEAENRERDWGETHTPYGRVRLARFARVRLLRHALPISLLILRKKPTVLQSTVRVKRGMRLRNGMWHGLRNDIIMRNLIYADHFQRSKLN